MKLKDIEKTVPLNIYAKYQPKNLLNKIKNEKLKSIYSQKLNYYCTAPK